MLNIYYGRESLNKDKFIFDNIEKGTILLVPDQYSLQAEKDAFFYLDTESLMDIEVLSFSRLRDRVIAETGGRTLPMIDKQGRHMLLTKIMNRCAGDLEVYGKYRRSSDFLDMANNMISELKQCGIGPEEIDGLLSDMEGSSLLKTKLAEIGKIYAEYEKTVEGHYTDTEDLAGLFTEKIKDSKSACEATYWIYGFDVFSPKNLDAISQLVRHSRGVNVVLTYDEGGRDESLFKVTGETISRLEKAGEDVNIRAIIKPIPESYREERPEPLAHVEREIFSLPYETCPGSHDDRIRIVRAKDTYAEAETAALTVAKLVREEGLRYRDILLICNDSESRAPEIRQVFERYGIDIFTDEKRGITHSPAATFVLSLMNIISDGYRADDVITLLRSGLGDAEPGEVDRLENYALGYRIRGAGWKNPFTKGAADLGAEELEELEAVREKVMTPILAFHEKYKEEKTVSGKVRVLYGFLEDMDVPGKLETLATRLDEEGDLAAAGETSQVWNKIVEVLGQLNEILGDEGVNAGDFADMIRTGLESVEIGILPQAADGLIMGTMQRTRTGRVKVLMILGANEGVFPLGIKSSGLLSDNERSRLMELSERRLLKTDELRMAEENMAIYHGLSKPEDMLYISCAEGSASGDASRPSLIYDRIKKMFPEVRESVDVIKSGRAEDVIGPGPGTLSHMAGALSRDEEIWKDTYAWYRENMPEELDVLKRGYLFNGRLAKADKEVATQLYRRDDGSITLSPTRLETYGGCPFAHFLNYGLKAKERKEYQITMLEIGTVFHECMDRLSKELGGGGAAGELTGEDSAWMTISREECVSRVNEIVDEIAAGFKDGLLRDSKTEEYRLSRMRKVCEESAMMVVDHVRAGKIVSMMSEVNFGKNGPFPPIAIDTDGGPVTIEGKIDRIDLLPEGYAKIIDYKSGVRKWDEKEVLSGWKLQLMLYMRAAKQRGLIPAGTFYFHLSDPVADYDKGVEKELKGAFRMEGIMIKDQQIVSEIDDELDISKNKASHILPPKSHMMEEEDFNEFMDEVDSKVDAMCGEILEGNIEIKPKTKGAGRKDSQCRYCKFYSVCKFDSKIDGFRYEWV